MKSRKRKYKYKKKFKGVQYIAKALRKYQKNKYPSYKKALPDARKFYETLKQNKETVKLDNIWNYSRQRRKRVQPANAPKIDYNLLQLSNYFLLVDYPTWILRCSKELFFISDLWDVNYEPIQGGTLCDYNKYFAPYVNYINSMKGLTDSADNRYATDWYVTCTDPTFNPNTKQWESKIISVDEDGDITNYNFDPKQPNKLASKVILSKDDKQQDKPVDKPKKPTTAKTDDIPGEREKQLNIAIENLKQNYKEGLIDKEFFQREYAKLLSKFESGGKI